MSVDSNQPARSATTATDLPSDGKVSLRVFVEPQQGASYADQLAVARAAEDLGYEAFFRSDHLLAFGSDGQPGPSESFVSLGAIAAQVRQGGVTASTTGA